MLWRSIKQENEVAKSKPGKSQESLEGTTAASENVFGNPNNRDIHDVSSPYGHPNKLNLNLTINTTSPDNTTKSTTVSPTNRKPTTPKSVSFATANWKNVSIDGIAKSLLRSLEVLLAEQRQVYDIDMFQELADRDQRESEFLQSYGYKFEETAFVIFNRKRELVIPAPGELYRIISPSSISGPPSSSSKSKPNSKYAAERYRRHQFVLATLSEEEQMCLTMMLSEQEEKFKVNMFEAMTDNEEAEISGLLAQGYKYDDIAHMIFQRMYEPDKPVQLIHPMQQHAHQPHSSFLQQTHRTHQQENANNNYPNQNYHGQNSYNTNRASYHNDNGSVSGFSMNSVSISSLNSGGSHSNLFKPMPANNISSNQSIFSATPSTATYNLHGTTLNNCNINTPPMHPNRRPSQAYSQPPQPPALSSSCAPSSNSSVHSSASSVGSAHSQNSNNSAMFRMPMSSMNHRPPLAGDLSPSKTKSAPSPGTRMWSNPLRNGGSSNNSVVSQGNASGISAISSEEASVASVAASVVSDHYAPSESSMSRKSVTSHVGDYSSPDAEALAAAIASQQEAFKKKFMAQQATNTERRSPYMFAETVDRTNSSNNSTSSSQQLLRKRSFHSGVGVASTNPLASSRRPSFHMSTNESKAPPSQESVTMNL